MASRVCAAAPQAGGRARDERGFGSVVEATAAGGILGGLAGLVGGGDD